MEPAIWASLIGATGAIFGAGIGGFAAFRIARANVRASIKKDLEDDLHEQMVWLRRKVREHEDNHRTCERLHQDCERRILAMQLEMGRLRAGLR